MYLSETPVKNYTDMAARVISSGQPTTRRFDSAFEWWGASAVAVALYRRTLKRPNTNLARNLFRYINEDMTLADAARFADWDDLEALARHLKEQQK
ncbi:hypothetical protein MHM88_14505 [Epibacterium sp. MM17-32]|uniref:hypothetical protein n=1 Tax=Epibacterium sp. MM17-32 TaxID=2917734 RepID=UPI001EF43DBA|nr:hypothetical protein [Epibacterium sp. MM17-32]MCG7629019.1 hypothetical protein [Epibacterium sp. MM17-32]